MRFVVPAIERFFARVRPELDDDGDDSDGAAAGSDRLR
jgi:hypothetical protein